MAEYCKQKLSELAELFGFSPRGLSGFHLEAWPNILALASKSRSTRTRRPSPSSGRDKGAAVLDDAVPDARSIEHVQPGEYPGDGLR
jgi:hypothetical protein